MVSRGDIDAVSNVTPDALHAPVSLAALTAGLPIFCEKPLDAFFRSDAKGTWSRA